MFKEKIIPILYYPFWDTEAEGILPNSSCECNVTLKKTRTHKDTTPKLQTNISDERKCQNPPQSIASQIRLNIKKLYTTTTWDLTYVCKSGSTTKSHLRWDLAGCTVQGTQAQSLFQDDPACWGATEPMRHYWAGTLEPESRNDWGLSTLEPTLGSKRSSCSEKPEHHKEEWLLLATTRIAMNHQHSQKKKNFNAIHRINRLKKKNLRILSVDAEKTCDKVQYL